MSIEGVKDELQAFCKNKDIPIKGEVLDEVNEGWEGKAKGMLPILWERGFIDPAKMNKLDYTLKGKKNAQGNIILEISLKHLMSLQTDFMEEETLFHFHAMEDFLAPRSSGLRSVILRLLMRAPNRFGVV